MDQGTNNTLEQTTLLRGSNLRRSRKRRNITHHHPPIPSKDDQPTRRLPTRPHNRTGTKPPADSLQAQPTQTATGKTRPAPPAENNTRLILHSMFLGRAVRCLCPLRGLVRLLTDDSPELLPHLLADRTDPLSHLQ